MAYLEHFNLAYPTHLQARQQSRSSNSIDRLGREDVAVLVYLTGDLYQGCLSLSGAVLTPPPDVSLARHLKWFTGAWQLGTIT